MQKYLTKNLVTLLVVISILSLSASGICAEEGAKLLRRYCFDCHDDQTREGGFSFENIRKLNDAEPKVWSAIREKIQLGEMPPEESEQPTIQERQLLAAWAAEAIQAAGHQVDRKLEWPNYGNYVDHHALFDAQPHPAPATSVRIWRYRPEFYSSVAGGGAIQPFSMLPGQQISDFSELFVVDESAAEIVLRNAQQLVKSRTQVAWVRDKLVAAPGTSLPSQIEPLLHPKQPPTDEEIATAISWQFRLATDRAPSEEELSRLANLFDRATKKFGRLQGVRTVMTAPLLLPETVYRVELGSGPLDEFGRRRLSRREIAVALHFALYSGRIDRSIKLAAETEQFDTADGVAQFATNLLNDGPTPRILTFFDEYFDYEKAVGVFKDTPQGLPYNAGLMVRDTKNLIQHIVKEDTDVLRTLLTTNQSFATFGDGYTRGMSQVYGLPHDFKPRDGQLVELAADQRAGILTQPAWLVAHSGNFDNDPVRRGKWIREHLLGGTVADVPITVDAVVPEDENQTLRERFEKIRQDKYCWKCHEMMNPLGMPFEAYDHFGRFRTKELKKPVVTSGRIDHAIDSNLHSEAPNAVNMIHRIANSKRTQQVFVRYAFRFFMGRNETVRDAKTLQEANRAYEESGGSMKTLVVSLLSSDSFLYRAPEL